jgi:hypothetical protein
MGSDIVKILLEAMSRDFFDPTPEQQNMVLINTATLHESRAAD